MKLVSAAPANRTALIAKLHVAKKQLGMMDEEYRAFLEKVTGKRSAADLDDAQLHKVLIRLGDAGFKPKKSAAPGGKAHVARVAKLWAELAATGVLKDASDTALRSFVQRQTGVSAPQFLNPKQANKVIEGLKSWIARVKGAAKC